MSERRQGQLSPNAYTILKDGEVYPPYIPADEIIPEITLRSVFWGALMALIFTAASAYLGLKIGQVFEAAIPIAILAVGLKNLFKRKSTILENVIIQSIGAASGVIVAGAIFTIPALYILDLPASFLKIFLASFIGGVLGIVFLIPLRRYFVREQHGYLPFPEGTATTEVLVTGESTGGGQALTLVLAALVGGLYDFCISTFGLWKEIISTRILPFGGFLYEKLRLVGKVNALAAVTGLGYIIGLRYALIICMGSFVSWFVLIPVVWYFGRHVDLAILPGTEALSSMHAEDIFANYIRHVGIGGIAAAGIIGIIKNGKIIISAFTLGFKQIFSRHAAATDERTDRDIPMGLVIGLILAASIFTFLFFGFFVVDSWGHAFAALLVSLIIGFLFTTVAARAIAIVGVNPVSGMTLMTLILSSFILLQIGLTGSEGMLAALIIGTVVCTSLSMSGGFITDLKIGYWLGSSPYQQERFKFLGTLIAASCVGLVMMLLNHVYGFVPSPEHTAPLAAPQANAMAAVLTAMFQAESAPWLLYLAGIMFAVILEFVGIPPLAFALGMYLPIELNTPLLVGGLISHWVGKSSKDEEIVKARKDKGTLIASGFIAGGSVMGVLSAVVAFFLGDRLILRFGEGVGGAAGFFHETVAAEWISLFCFIGLCAFLYFYAKSAKK